MAKRYSIPLPKGGRHNTDIILCEDQLLRNRKPKAKADDAFDAAAAGFGAVGVSHSENARYAWCIFSVDFSAQLYFLQVWAQKAQPERAPNEAAMKREERRTVKNGDWLCCIHGQN